MYPICVTTRASTTNTLISVSNLHISGDRRRLSNSDKGMKHPSLCIVLLPQFKFTTEEAYEDWQVYVSRQEFLYMRANSSVSVGAWGCVAKTPTGYSDRFTVRKAK